MTSKTKPALLAAIVIACTSSAAHAASKQKAEVPAAAAVTPIATQQDAFGPIPSPHDSRNVTFTYEGSVIYNLFAQAGQFVQIILGADEEIATIQVSDPVRWKHSRVEEADIAPRVFIKPTQSNLATTVTIVTAVKGGGERVYDLRIESAPDGGKRYQRVQWHYPQVEERKRNERRRIDDATAREHQRIAELEVTPALSIDSLNWGYDVRGKAGFRPSAVFDDGRFIYLRMPPNEEWPAVFMGERGEAVMVKTARRGEYLVVQRLVDRLLLKIEGQEVEIAKQSKSGRGWFGGRD